MAENSKIAWTNHTFNPWRGCSKVSPGCAACYAEALSKRNPAIFGKWGDQGTRVVASEAMWKEPVKWNRSSQVAMRSWEHTSEQFGEAELLDKGFIKPSPHRVFCASVADVFEDWQGRMLNAKGEKLFVTASGWTTEKFRQSGERRFTVEMQDVRRRLFGLIDATPNLDWLLLTKRPENIRNLWVSRFELQTDLDEFDYRENVWLGTTCENQEQANKRIPHLLNKCSDLSPVLWLSVEPMLGPVEIAHWICVCKSCLTKDISEDGGWPEYPKIKWSRQALVMQGWQPPLQWVVCGCEQGNQHIPLRPMNLDWARSLRDQCQAAGVPFFMKQIAVNGRVTDDINDFPSDLQIRQFPNSEKGKNGKAIVSH